MPKVKPDPLPTLNSAFRNPKSAIGLANFFMDDTGSSIT
jgi:hypothetical protein